MQACPLFVITHRKQKVRTMSKTLQLYSIDQLREQNAKNCSWAILNNRIIVDLQRFISENDDKISSLDKENLLALKGKALDSIWNKFNDLYNDSFIVGYLATEQEEKQLLTNKDHIQEVRLESTKPKLNESNDFDSTTFIKKLPTEEKLSIATNYNSDFEKHHFLDLNKPLIPQVLFGNFTREFYVDQIHRPRHYGKGSAPLFGNFLEPISLTPWYVIPIVWLPVVIYHISVALLNMNPFFAIVLFGIGVFVWTLIEYCMHRFLFHFDDWLPENNICFVIHFLLHGVHHYLPMDPYRLVMPPTLFVVLCTPFYRLVFKALPLYWAYAGFAGGLFGYVAYDQCHYFLHHSRMPKPFRKLKKYHLEHHYKNYQLGFGVTSWFWDKVFGTYLANDSPLSPMKYD